MITLYTFGPYFGLPDASPFVTKAMLLLKFAALSMAKIAAGLDGMIVADSTFIRLHIENKYGFDFDAGLDAGQKATAWAIEKMCEEHLYFAFVATRWLDDANFAKGAAQFFKTVPMPLRPIVQSLVRRKVKKALNLQGFGRHTPAERDALAMADINALAALIGDKAFELGEKPCGADATVFSLRRELSRAGVRHADPYGGGTPRQSHRLPRPDPAALFRWIGRGWVFNKNSLLAVDRKCLLSLSGSPA
jgi:hypothetical protein